MLSTKFSFHNSIQKTLYELKIAFFLLLFMPAMASETVAQIELSQEDFHHPIRNYELYLTDKPLSFTEIQSLGPKFYKLNKAKPKDFDLKYAWIKFELYNQQGTANDTWQLVLNIFPFDDLSYFVSQKDGLWRKETIQPGTDRFPRTLSTQFAIPINNLRPVKNTVYLRFDGHGDLTKIPTISLYSNDEFQAKHSNQLIFMGGIIAILGAMVFYNLILSFIVRRRYFISYCLFNTAFAMVAVVGSNVFYDSFHIFTGPKWWNYIYFFAGFGGAMMNFFLLDFLEEEIKEKWMTYAILIAGITLIIISIRTLFVDPKSFSEFIFTYNIFVTLSVLTFLGVLIKCVLNESRVAKIILISVLLFFIAFIVKFLYSLNVNTQPLWVNNLLYLGFAFQGVFLSIALADRMNQRKMESEVRRLEAVEEGKSNLDMIYTDGLTGLRNRRFIEKSSPEMLKPVQKGKGDFSLIICSIDGLSRINRNHGRESGDAAIKAVADIFRKSMPGDDRIARYRGNEYVILLDGSNESVATGLANQLKELILHIKLPEHIKIAGLTFSIGTSPAVKKDKNIEDVIKRAEMALFAAQQGGGNQVISLEALSGLMNRNLLPEYYDEIPKPETKQESTPAESSTKAPEEEPPSKEKTQEAEEQAEKATEEEVPAEEGGKEKPAEETAGDEASTEEVSPEDMPAEEAATEPPESIEEDKEVEEVEEVDEVNAGEEKKDEEVKAEKAKDNEEKPPQS